MQKDSELFLFPRKQSSLPPGLCSLRGQHNSPQKTRPQEHRQAELKSLFGQALALELSYNKINKSLFGICHTLLNSKNKTKTKQKTIQNETKFKKPPATTPFFLLPAIASTKQVNFSDREFFNEFI